MMFRVLLLYILARYPLLAWLQYRWKMVLHLLGPRAASGLRAKPTLSHQCSMKACISKDVTENVLKKAF